MLNNRLKLVLICLTSFSLGCTVTTFLNQKVQATAPNIAPTLEKKILVMC
jgi:hypothetical protein